MINLPFETFNVRSYESEMRRALRTLRGFPAFQLTLDVGEKEASFLADYGGLSADLLELITADGGATVFGRVFGLNYPG